MSDPVASDPFAGRRRARRRLWRTALAILLAPSLGGAIFGAGIALFEFGPSRALETLAVGAAFGAIIGSAFGIPLIATLGLLFDWAARARGWTRWWHYMLGGAVAGILGLACLTVYDAVSSSARLLPENEGIAVFQFVAGGPIVAVIAWLIRRPDRD